MPVERIAESYKYICDGCGDAVNQAYNSKPMNWSRLVIERDAYDFQGAGVASLHIKRVLCERCTTDVVEAINHTIMTRNVKNVQG